jgi:hypothetical protein
MVPIFEEIWASLSLFKFQKINFMSDSMEQMDGSMDGWIDSGAGSNRTGLSMGKIQSQLPVSFPILNQIRFGLAPRSIDPDSMQQRAHKIKMPTFKQRKLCTEFHSLSLPTMVRLLIVAVAVTS